MEKKLKQPYVTNYKLLIAQNLWQAHDQILLIILLNKFIKLNVNMDMVIKHVKHKELNTKIVSVFLNTQMLKMI